MEKYILYESKNGLQLFSLEDDKCKIKRYRGEDTYEGTDYAKYMEWINSSEGSNFEDAYCFISLTQEQRPDFLPPITGKTEWTKSDIKVFADTVHKKDACEFIIKDSTGNESVYLRQHSNRQHDKITIFVVCGLYKEESFKEEKVVKDTEPVEYTGLISSHYANKYKRN